MDFSTRDSAEFQGQFLDREEVAPDELRTVLLAFNPSPPAITRQLDYAEDDRRAWLLLARAAHGLVVVTGSGQNWTMESRTRPADAAIEADWYPLDAIQRISITDSNLELTSRVSGRFKLGVAWAIHVAGRKDPLILNSDPDSATRTVDDFARGLLEDRGRLGLGSAHAPHGIDDAEPTPS